MTGPMRILLIDDNPDDRSLVLRELRHEYPDVVVRQVANQAELADVLESGGFDLVITDYQLRWSDGMTILRLVKARAPDCPVVMFTATGNEEIAVSAMKAGLEDYVLKTAKHFARLPAAVRSAVQKSQQRSAIREAESRYRTLFEGIPLGLYRSTADGRLLDANPALVHMLGYPDKESLLATDPETLYTDPSQRRMWRHLMAEDGVVQGFEVALRRKDGTVIWARSSDRVERDAEGRILYYEGVIENISARRWAEERLRESEQRYVSMFYESHAMMLLVEPRTGRIIDANPAALRFYGHSRDEITSLTLAQLSFRPSEEIESILGEVEQGRCSLLDSRHRLATGEYRDVLIYTGAMSVRGERLIYLIVHDTSDRTLAEEQLRISQDQVRLIAENAPDLIFRYRIRPTRTIEYVSPACLALTGYTQDDFIQDPNMAMRVIHPEDLPRFGQLLRLKQSESTMTVRLVHRDGSIRWCEQRSKAVRNGRGRITAFEGIARDISDRIINEGIEALLRRIDERVLQGETLEPILPFVCSSLVELLGHPSVWIGTKESDGTIRIRGHAGSGAAGIETIQIRWDSGNGDNPAGEAIRTGTTRLASWRPSGPGSGSEPALCLMLPLRTHDRVLGVIAFHASESQTFDARGIARYEYLAASISVALSQAIDLQQVRLQGAALSAAANAIFITDRRGVIEWVNPAFTKVTQYAAEDVIGKTPRVIRSGQHGNEIYREMWDTVLGGQVWWGELLNRRKDGSLFTVEESITPLLDPAGNVTHAIAILQDITAQRKAEERVHYLAYYDVLTGLPNRILFRDRLHQAMAHARRERSHAALMFLDLDRFKTINDTLGHEVGDALLRGVAERLSASFREGDTLARHGGDEFLLISQGLVKPQDAAVIARKVLECLHRPFVLHGHEIFTTASIGIFVLMEDAIDEEGAIKNAEIAMFRCKERGGNSYEFHTAEMNALALERLALENSLRRAVDRGQLFLAYQPQAELNTGKIIGLEALTSWNHPDLGVVPPAQFIPIAEETGLITGIGEWVLRSACLQAKAWQDAGLPSVRMAVNLSSHQLRQSNFASMVREILAETKLHPRYLELELTEGAIMDNPERAIEILRDLKAYGVSISIDDFGMGYSSLSYLKRFPIDVLKIDKSFVRGIPDDPEDAAIVTAVVALAKNLNLRVIAEGVEREEQLAFLQARGCSYIQGYVCSRPASREQIEMMLTAGICSRIGRLVESWAAPAPGARTAAES